MAVGKVGLEILVSTSNDNDQDTPQITALANGGLAVTWTSFDNDLNYDIRGQVFAADGTPIDGSDFLVSTSNNSNQTDPQITALANGGFAVTWQSRDNGSNLDIRGQVFAADGTPIDGSDFLVSTSNNNSQFFPQVTALANGGFAVTWHSFNNGSNSDIRGQVFAADGTPIDGSDFLVSTSNDNDQSNPQITALANGGFAVTWHSFNNGSNSDIRGQVFAPDGTPNDGSDFLVSTSNDNDQSNPQITALANGGFAVTWHSFNNGTNSDIRGQVFAADGTPIDGSDFLVSTSNNGNQSYPQITALANGGFAVTWYSADNGSNLDIRGQVFAPDGTPIDGSDFLVSTSNDGNQHDPQITARANGGFAVTWYSADSGLSFDIRGRVFAADGAPIDGSDFLVSSSNDGNQYAPQITALADGGFAVTWFSSDNGSNYDIRAQVFAVGDSEPTLSATAQNPAYTEDSAAVDLYNAVKASTVDSGQTFASMRLTVTNVTDGASEILRIGGSDVALTSGNSITTATNGLTVNVAVASNTATVSFTGATLSATQLQTLVDGLSYRNSSQNPTDANRVVTITELVDSGGNTGLDENTAALSIAATVNVNPVNDDATITGDAAGAVTEAGSASSGTPTDSGDLNAADPDNPADTWQVVAAGTASLGGFGTYAVTAAGVWTYTLDNTDATVQALDSGDSLQDAFNVVTVDGTTQLVTVAINGQDDIRAYNFYWYDPANSGDYYYGVVYDDGTYGYAVGQTVNGPYSTTEAGASNGYYYVYASASASSDHSVGEVHTHDYYDAHSGRSLNTYGETSGSASGYYGLGYEYDWILNSSGNWDDFGRDWYEANHAPPFTAYNFYWYDPSNSGDFYYGVVYDDGTYGYAVGQTINGRYSTTESGSNNGYYYIYSSGTAGSGHYAGEVHTHDYYDAQSSGSLNTYSETSGAASGYYGLGYEYDWILDSAGSWDDFGQDWYEANYAPALTAYNFYWYDPANSGDFYYGVVYDDGTYGYAVGQTINGPYSTTEAGSSNGSYYIYSSGSAGSGHYAGEVHTYDYYDAQSGRSLNTYSETSGAASGYYGLGYEYDWVQNSSGSWDGFGYDWYLANYL